MTQLLQELTDIVGAEHVLTDSDAVSGYTVDWTQRFSGQTPAVVRPADVEQVAAIVQACNASRTAIVPQGGNTGMVGGGVPLQGEIVLSTRRLTKLSEVDPLNAQISARAGITLGALQQTASGAGWEFGVDLSARDSATVGGMVATNAGGLRFLRYGGMREQLVGLEAVLGNGKVVRHMSGLRKDNTGYDWPALLCGSEGTLGVVTEARFQLVPHFHYRVTALLACKNLADALQCVRVLRGLSSLDGLEVFSAAGMELVAQQSGKVSPFSEDFPFYLVVECADQTDPTDLLAVTIESLGIAISDVAVGTDDSSRAELWHWREMHSEAIATYSAESHLNTFKYDVTLPLQEMEHFYSAVTQDVAKVIGDSKVFIFGHLGDGNLHVNVVASLSADESEALDTTVLELVATCGGSISAEHGVGTAKKRFLHLNRSKTELDLFRSLKQALDPNGVLNPNVLLP